MRRVVAAAFQSDVEADLVDRIRDDACYRPTMALVAERDGEIVGHVMVSDCELHDDARGVHTIAMLSPLAVDPEVQKDGIGSALVRGMPPRR